jgi:penicillin-binding protein 2
VSDARIRWLQLAAAATLVALALQLVRVQLLDPFAFDDGEGARRLRDLPVEAARGLVLDRDGVVLARNVPAYSIAVVPGKLPAAEAQRREVLLAVERHLGVPLASIERALGEGLAAIDPFAPVTLRGGIAREQAIVLRAAFAGLHGLHVRTQPVRVYEGGELLAHVLGHVGPIPEEAAAGYLEAGYQLDARVGQSGVEVVYEPELRGTPGRRVVLADAAGRELERLGEVAPEPGADLVLSIDLDLQRAAAAAVARGIEAGIEFALSRAVRHGDPLERTGAAVVMDVRSGELLALVSIPSFDANAFSGLEAGEDVARLLGDETRPLVHRAYQDVQAPGSIFKPLVGAAALEEGVATPSTRITSTGAITVRSVFDPSVSYTFRDWAAHGTLDFYGGLTRSSDVYYYYLSGGYAAGGRQLFEGLGVERIASYVRAFGLGAPTGLDLPGEAGGLVPDIAWKERTVGEPWVLGDTYTLGIGQGYLTVTPLQMAVAMAALANGGEVLVPRVLRGFRTGHELRLAPREVAGVLPVAPEHLEVVREALRRTADPGGTATLGEPPGVTIAGKTGTAEFGRAHPDGGYDSHGWFLAFAPYEEPEIAVVVYLAHGVGATHAGPVAREILEAYFAPEDASSAARLASEPAP